MIKCIDFNLSPSTLGRADSENTHRLVSSFTSLDSAVSLHTKNNIISLLVKSSLIKLETTSRTVILPPTVSILSG